MRAWPSRCATALVVEHDVRDQASGNGDQHGAGVFAKKGSKVCQGLNPAARAGGRTVTVTFGYALHCACGRRLPGARV